MLAQRLEVVVVERQDRAAVDVDERVIDQVRIARKQVFLGDHDVEGERRLAQDFHQVGDGLGGDVPVAAVLELGDSQRTSLGRISLEVDHVVDDQLVSRHLAAGGVVDDVLTDLDRLDDRGVGRAALQSGSSSRRGRPGNR